MLYRENYVIKKINKIVSSLCKFIKLINKRVTKLEEMNSLCIFCTYILMFLCNYAYGDENKDIVIAYGV